MDTANIWKIVNTYFEDNPQSLVAHHLESYNDFFKNGIFQIFKEKNPVSITSLFDEDLGDFKHQCNMYLGGKDGSRIYFGKPVIYDEKNAHYMFPNEARLRNMTYGMTVHYDIEIEFTDLLSQGETPNVVADVRGGNGIMSEGGETDDDYKHQITRSFENVKMGGDQLLEQDIDNVKGGVPKKPRQEGRKKVTREKRTVKPFQMTPALSAAIREATEKSLETSESGRRTQTRTMILPKIYLGKFPIMLHSDFCVLKGLPPEIRHTMGECRSDIGGYFIIQGLEKTVITQEKFADNMLWVRKGKDALDDDGNLISVTDYLYSIDIRSVSENVSKPIRNLSVQIVAPTASYTNRQIVVNVPNVRKPVPLFILFRALGILTDKAIIEMCLLDLDKYEHMVDTFIPSVHDAGSMMTQALAVEYIASLTKGKRQEHALEILADYFLPHIGEVNYTEKAHYLGYMVFRLLAVSTGLEIPTDRDNFKYKRLELVGSLMYDLFREYYNLQLKHIMVKFEERLLYSKILYEKDLQLLIQTFQDEVFKTRVVEAGFKKAFKGNWGAATNTKRVGIIQDLNRLSFNSYLSHLRKTNLPMDAGSKLVEPRKLHCSQWGYIDPIDTPDGGNIGLHKSLAIMTHVTRGGQSMRAPLVQWMREKIALKYVEECSPKMLSNMTKVMVNGFWAGSILDPFDCVKKIKLFRRNALLPIFMSVTFEIKQNTIYIYTDAGRVSRPIFYRDDDIHKMSFEFKDMKKILDGKEEDIRWEDLTTGFNTKRKDAKFDPHLSRMYELNELYEGTQNETNPAKMERFLTKKAPIDYLDCSESENALICLNTEQYAENPTKKYTHMEIHESLIFGNMCNLIVFPESNPPTRNSFSCGQSKQAVSMYHTNYQVRMDKTAVVLNTGQTPLVKTRFLDHINHEENPYGVNAIVAIMCYTGYNVEDAVLINEGALKRGLFRTTYYTTYQAHEETTKNMDTTTDIKFANIESEVGVVGTKPGYDYSRLDIHGVIKEGTVVDDKTVLIGLVAASSGDAKKVDGSKTTKKGQLGTVDKTFITEGEEGERIAKVRIREERVPNLGDKFACALPTQQVLTQYGWINMIDIDISVHKVATLDVNGHMCYEYPVNKFIYDHEGEMYYVKNKQVHVVCTLNHKLYVKKRFGKTYELIEARDVMGKMVRFQKTMTNTQPDVEWMDLCTKRYKMDDWLQLLGMFISDGSVNNRGTILSCHKQRKVDFNTHILTKLGLKFKHDSFQGYFALNKGEHPEIYEELQKYSLGAANKVLPEYVWDLSQRQCIILMEALMEGDGHTYKDGFSRYGTISVNLANDISRLAVHCGWSGVIKNAGEPDGIGRECTGTMGYKEGKTNIITQKHTYYKISIIRKQNEPYINKKKNESNEEKLMKYCGKVYCIEMASSNLYYMRENFLAPSMLIGNSRAGQKGTVGLVIPEADMPFNKDGIRPDMIVNPHALPSRMTIGHLVETLMGKTCSIVGGFGDGTAFLNKGSKVGVFGEMLSQVGYHSSGNEILYNGMTGEQIEAEVFFGPTYYMRLKHMVKDKINYRALGPRTALTKQAVHGRANDGGLRIGEMERDSVIAHGITNFMTESMMERGDKYHIAVCNTTGMLAICNPSKNLFMSPMADGPIQFVGSLDGKEMYIENVTKYGRNFSVVSIPYTMKLLIQELQCANIQMRIITEDSLPQLENMMFSKNIEKLMSLEEGSKVEVEIRKQIQENMKDPTENPEVREIMANAHPDKTPENSPEWYVTGGKEETCSSNLEIVPYDEENDDDKDFPSKKQHISSFEIMKPEEENLYDNDEYDEDNTLQQGDSVYYRGDTTRPLRPWTILEMSPTFVTIQQTQQHPDDPQEIKVVRHNELYLPGEVPAIVPNMFEMGQGEPIHLNPHILPPEMREPETPNINFNPIINVVAGDNKGNIDFTEKQSKTPNSDSLNSQVLSSTSEQSPSGMIIGEKETSSSEPKGFSFSKSGEPVDFSKLIVIKKGE
jgi:DNA-directed RNA polymerase beta subunit